MLWKFRAWLPFHKRPNNQQIPTTLNSYLNSALSNAPWHEKRKTLDKHTVLFLNKDLLANASSGWDETTIADRGKRLHQAAVRVWPHAASIR